MQPTRITHVRSAVPLRPHQRDASAAHTSSPSHGLQTGGMNTKIIFTRYSPLRTVLVNEATGQELYRIHTPRRFARGVTRVFRCDPATPPSPNPVSASNLDADAPHEGSGSGGRNLLTGAEPDDSEEENEDGGEDGVNDVGEEALKEDTSLVENEIARWYWRWFSSPRLVFEGKIRTRAEYMPLRNKLRR